MRHLILMGSTFIFSTVENMAAIWRRFMAITFKFSLAINEVNRNEQVGFIYETIPQWYNFVRIDFRGKQLNLVVFIGYKFSAVASFNKKLLGVNFARLVNQQTAKIDHVPQCKIYLGNVAVLSKIDKINKWFKLMEVMY